jgi:hypothetical protein
MKSTIDRTAIRERNEWLQLHYMARTGRPSVSTMSNIAARYKAARFRVHQDVVRLEAGVRTIFKPKIEILAEVKGRWQWITYMWLDHEEVAEDDEWFIQRMERAGLTRAQAKKRLSNDYADAAVEDGYDGPL